MKLYSLNEDNIAQWIVYIIGPPDTLYAGGIFKALIRFPDSFPMDPPSVQFLSKFFHPNVYRDGKVCISTLQHPIPDHLRDDGDSGSYSDKGYWSPANGTETILMSIVSLLSDPNPDDPANAEAANLYCSDRTEFNKKVKETIEDSIKAKPTDLQIDEADYLELPKADTMADSGMIDDLASSDDESNDFDFDSGSDGEVGIADSEDED